MTDAGALLPSWRPGPTRDALVGFLDAADELPPDQRVAAFDNDGTLWCERPTYVQYEFFVDALRRAVATEPEMAHRPEYAAVLTSDAEAIGELGLARVALALAELFEGMTPEAFTLRVREFLARSRHGTLGVGFGATVYQPMIELIDELRRRSFAVTLVTGGGTEFVRAISHELYGVAPEAVVGTLIDYRFTRDHRGRVVLQRTAGLVGGANEGPAKVTNIQTQVGRRPVLAAGNSAGDREMLEWATAGDGPSLALLIDHDDEDREFRYVSEAGTIVDTEPITDVSRRQGWTVVSMARDWDRIFPAPGPGG